MRRLSDEAFTAGLAAQKHFLRAPVHRRRRSSTTTRSNCIATSLGLLQDVQLILLGFGVQSDFSSRYAKAEPSSREGGAVAQRRPVRSAGDPPTSSGRRDGLRARDADYRRHGLRIDPGSLRSFGKHIGAPARQKARTARQRRLASRSQAHGRIRGHAATSIASRRSRTSASSRSSTSPSRSPARFIANGITVHNCSEYMFLDDTACNLASLNVLTFFDAESRRFDIEGYKHAIRLWTIVLEISVLMASFPSRRDRPAQLQVPHAGPGLCQPRRDADAGGHSVRLARRAARSARRSPRSSPASPTPPAPRWRSELGAFPGYEQNQDDMLRVIRNHRRAAYDVAARSPGARKRWVEYEALDIHPVGIDASQFAATDPLASEQLLAAAQECWDRALLLGERHGYRNAQTTVIAPTGTIGLLMDCDTTGVEPDFALVKFKKLAGGGYFKIANQSLRPALVNLGYSAEQIHDILKYVMGTLTLHDAAAHQLREPAAARASPRPSWRRSKLAARRVRAVLRLQPLVARRRASSSGWTSPRPNGRRPASTCCDGSASRSKQIDDANDAHLRPRHRRRRSAPQAPSTSPSSTAPTSAARPASASSPSKATSA